MSPGSAMQVAGNYSVKAVQTQDHSWVCSEGPAGTGHGPRGAVVGWYLPVLVVDERELKKVGGVRVVVLMRRVAVGYSRQNSWRG